MADLAIQREGAASVFFVFKKCAFIYLRISQEKVVPLWTESSLRLVVHEESRNSDCSV